MFITSLAKLVISQITRVHLESYASCILLRPDRGDMSFCGKLHPCDFTSSGRRIRDRARRLVYLSSCFSFISVIMA